MPLPAQDIEQTLAGILDGTLKDALPGCFALGRVVGREELVKRLRLVRELSLDVGGNTGDGTDGDEGWDDPGLVSILLDTSGLWSKDKDILGADDGRHVDWFGVGTRFQRCVTSTRCR